MSIRYKKDQSVALCSRIRKKTDFFFGCKFRLSLITKVVVVLKRLCYVIARAKTYYGNCAVRGINVLVFVYTQMKSVDNVCLDNCIQKLMVMVCSRDGAMHPLTLVSFHNANTIHQFQLSSCHYCGTKLCGKRTACASREKIFTNYINAIFFMTI